MEIREAQDDLRDEEFPDEESLTSDDDSTRPCPACGAPVHELSDHCPRCGHWLLDADSPVRHTSLLLAIIAALTALALLFYLLGRA